MKDMLEYNGRSLIWRQRKNPIFISVFELPYTLNDNKYESLMMELINKNTTFSIFINAKKLYLILYYCGVETENFDYLVEKFGLVRPNELKNLFLPTFTKIQKQKNTEIVSVNFSKGNNKFYKIYLLSSGSINRKSNEFLYKLIETKVFSIVISSFPVRKSDDVETRWGLMIILEGNEIESVKNKDKLLIQIIKTSQASLNWQLTAISKSELLAHKANFRLLVPWKKLITNYSSIKELFLQKFIRFFNIEWNAPIEKKEIEENTPNTEETSDKIETPPKKTPYPSVKQLKNVKKTDVISSTIPLPPRPYKSYAINTQSNDELLKIRISNGLKQYGFKSTVLFQDSFDLVLRNGSFYVFIKIINGTLKVSQTYRIIDQLSSIAGLKDKFLCIIIADYIEDKAISISRGYPIMCLLKQEVTSESMIITKIRDNLDLFVAAPIL